MAFHNANPLRSISTFRPAGMVFGPSLMDRLIGDLRAALDRRDGYCPAYAQACANQAAAFKAINAARAAIRVRAKAVEVAHAALLDAGMTLDAIAAACPAWEA